MTEFVRTTRIQRPAAEVFSWHERPGAFERLAPPWMKIKVDSAGGGIGDGAEICLTQKVGPLPVRWRLRHEGFIEGRSFSDRQISGPFANWIHHHTFEPVDDHSCDMTDRIHYELPGGSVSEGMAGSRVHRELERLFRFRHEVTRMDLETHRLPEVQRSLTVAVSGATGLVGSTLTAMLRTAGHEVRVISRGGSADIQWDPENGKLDPEALEETDAIIHLAGEPIAQRWTRDARERILESRRKGTRLLAETAARLKRPPRAFVSISGLNAYGVRRPDGVTEKDAFGDGFLSEVCREWENASAMVESVGIRRVIVRSGIVLSPAGGALGKLLPVFRAGLGGPVGAGKRWMSWIAIDDVAGILAHAALDERYDGLINAVAPDPVQNREFAKTIGGSLLRPAAMPVPPAVLKLAFGRMAEETILSDLKVESRRLGRLGYRFRFPHLREALNHLLGSGN